jgi:hypothetical protein
VVKGGRKREKEEVAFAVEVFELDTWWNARIRANIVDIYINRREMLVSEKGAKCGIREGRSIGGIGGIRRQYFRPCGRRHRIRRVQVVILYKYLRGFTYEAVSDNSDSHFNNL